MDNPISKGKIIYNISVSLFMLYFLFRSLYAFFDYTFNYEDKLYAVLDLRVELKEPVTVEQLQKKLAGHSFSIEPMPGTSYAEIRCHNSEFKELPRLKKEISTLLQNQLPEGSYAIIKSQFIPPRVSKRIFRLELSVYIPAFLMAFFWFFYVYKWINEIREFIKQKEAPQPPTGKKAKKH